MISSLADSGATSRIVVLLCHERSGSSLLRDLMAGHPDVAVAGDVFNYAAFGDDAPHSYFAHEQRLYRHNPALAAPTPENIFVRLDSFFAELLSGSFQRRILLDLKYAHLASLSGHWFPSGWPSAVFDYIAERPVDLIHLYRRNVFEAVTSLHLAAKRGIWNAVEGSELRQARVRLTREILAQKLAGLALDIGVVARKCKKLGGLSLTYEELADPAARPGALERVTHHLRLAPFASSETRLVKVSPPPEVYISNFDELRDLAEIYADIDARPPLPV